eukprot:jgi/Botrbrau1/19714/Bobra.0003s0074.1
MLQRPDFAIDPLLSLLGECAVDTLLPHRCHAGSPPSEEVLRAAIDRHLPISSPRYFTGVFWKLEGRSWHLMLWIRDIR